MAELRELFTPLKIGPMEVVNRIMMSGMSAGMVLDKDGNVTPEMIAYFIERIRNNPGLSAIGASAVVPSPEGVRYPLPIYSDHIVPRFASWSMPSISTTRNSGSSFGMRAERKAANGN